MDTATRIRLLKNRYATLLNRGDKNVKSQGVTKKIRREIHRLENNK